MNILNWSIIWKEYDEWVKTEGQKHEWDYKRKKLAKIIKKHVLAAIRKYQT